MQASQIQLDITAHNIANVNREGFSRQRVDLVTRRPNIMTYGAIGRGVQVENITRVRDEFLDLVYRQQVAALGRAETQAQYFELIEDSFLEPTEDGFGTRINLFFDALNDFAANVEESPVREALLSEAASLAASLNDMAGRFHLLRTNANEEVRDLVPEINSLTARIADANLRIRDAEVSGRTASDLRDERGVLLDELSQILNITYRERADGQVDILLGSSMLLEGDRARELEAVRDASIDPERGDLLAVRFADNGETPDLRDGRLFGVINMRDNVIVDFENRINNIASTIIHQINRVHSQGNGLANLSGTITGTNAVASASTALSAAGLPWAITPGTFDVLVYDAAGNPTTTTVTIDATTSLDDLAAALNAIPNFSASVADNRLVLGADAGFTFSFANDSTGALAVLGVNTLFTGTDARDIAVNALIEENPGLLASGFSSDLLNTGDNAAALALAELRNLQVMDGDRSTIDEYYQATVARMGVEARANTQRLEIEQSFSDDFLRRREEASGVSLDEEVANLLLFQRAYEASARVITVADRMLEALLNIV